MTLPETYAHASRLTDMYISMNDQIGDAELAVPLRAFKKNRRIGERTIDRIILCLRMRGAVRIINSRTPALGHQAFNPATYAYMSKDNPAAIAYVVARRMMGGCE